jgi:hypothetical protein
MSYMKNQLQSLSLYKSTLMKRARVNYRVFKNALAYFGLFI